MPFSQPSRSVFIVDDDPVLIAVIAAWLAGLGCSSAPASTAAEATHVVSTGHQFGVLLIDLHLGQEDGSAVTRALLPQLPKNCKRILMSAGSPSAEQLRVFHASLRKPFTAQQLSAALEGTPKAQPPQAFPVDSLLDPDVFANLSASVSPLVLRELYVFTFIDARQRIEHLAASLANGEIAEARRSAHALRGSCAMTGLVGIAALAEMIEQEPNPALFQRTHFLTALDRVESMLKSQLFLQD